MTGNKGYSEFLFVWDNLPDNFKKRWNDEARGRSMTGFNLFIKTNMNAVRNGGEYKIAPWF